MTTPPMNYQLQILSEYCDYAGLTFRLLDEFSSCMAEVKNDAGRRFLCGAGSVPTLPLNSSVTSAIAKDKAHTYELLKRAGIGIPKGDRFFVSSFHQDMRPAGKEVSDAMAYAESLGYPVFVKPNMGSLGTFAELVDSSERLQAHLQLIAGRDYMAHIQEPIIAPEYRVYVLDGQVQFAYSKTPAQLHGDGKHTIQELLEVFNQGFVHTNVEPIQHDNPMFIRDLQAKGLALSTIMASSETMALGARLNITAGAQICDYRSTVSTAVQDWVTRLIGALPLRIAGIDVFAPQGFDQPESFKVIEVNSNPALGGIYDLGEKEKVFQILDKVCHQAFAQSGQ